MKIEEACCCGADIKVDWGSLSSSYRRDDEARDRQVATKQLDNFRRRHKDCAKLRLVMKEGQTDAA